MYNMNATLTQAALDDMILLTAIRQGDFKKWEAAQSTAVRNWINAQKWTAKPGASLLIPDKDGHLSRVVAVLSDEISLWDLAALPGRLPRGTYVLEGVKNAQDEGKLALGWMLGGYEFPVSKKNEKEKATLCLSKKVDSKAISLMAETIAQARAIITTPAQDMGPQELAQQAEDLAKTYKGKVTCIVGEDLLKKGFRAIHAVGRASDRAPRLVDLRWGKESDPKVTLIGKGVCFDTGGLDLKPPSAMLLMRKDMGGAAVALGVARLMMANKLPVRLRVLIPAVENAIGGNAFRPSDVITMKNGLKVEIGNTDAEGRLVLADALAYATEEKTDLLIDFATLGPARGIFGPEIATFYTHDEAIAKNLAKISVDTEDTLWRMPFHPAYTTMLETPFADVTSSPGQPYAGSGIAASFLEKFCADADKRIHFDFMGWHPKAQPGRPQGGEAMTLRAAYALVEKMYGDS